MFFNPGKYELQAGGIGKDWYSSPSLNQMSGVNDQTLVNATVCTVLGPDGRRHTRLPFIIYLKGPD